MTPAKPMKDVEEKEIDDKQIGLNLPSSEYFENSNLQQFLINFILIPMGKKKIHFFIIYHFLMLIKNELKIAKMQPINIFFLPGIVPSTKKREFQAFQNLTLCICRGLVHDPYPWMAESLIRNSVESADNLGTSSCILQTMPRLLIIPNTR